MQDVHLRLVGWMPSGPGCGDCDDGRCLEVTVIVEYMQIDTQARHNRVSNHEFGNKLLGFVCTMTARLIITFCHAYYELCVPKNYDFLRADDSDEVDRVVRG